ncbi:MAG: glycosyltransferase 87 family protein [Propionicimonas sp.]|uniref:glycosyltransferase family 87 protein n=1 Tax=Propionicimonas sp. TaxID=1955623 RepID=UPI002B208AC8|nr:glycosyltransferase 87 family protein [Propionicimonas sp.]MEA4943991.1 glycosyltransferase 87 family protein [Propionicimonas sp.]MEA5052029.1 glycosyltransferase 87 family protein [Propionicimonas sp.]MEA5117179.1 glycosyltransferase 87 family protein [Propionicimonas sp.]
MPSPARVLPVGGPDGRHALPGGLRFAAGPWSMLALTVSWVVLMLRQLPCREGADYFPAMCYSDISALFYWRGVSEGQVPFLQADLEYPVLTGFLIDLTRRLTNLLGGRTEPGLTDDQVAHAAGLFFGVNAVVLFLLFVVLVWAHLKMSRPRDALMIAAAPAIFTTGLINWDALVLALLALALLAWSRKSPVWTGIWLGLAIAAKLYPVLMLVPLAVLCLRASRWRAFFTTVGATAASWVAVNLPVYLLAPQGWLNFWTFNVDRGGDLGSIWYALRLSGVDITGVSGIEAGVMVAGSLGLGLLLLFAPRRPRLAQGLFLIVVLFLLVNKVYSPQYTLWLLPLLVLARPRWLDWVVFSLGELVYFVAIWAHLDGVLTSGGGGDGLYVASIFLRIGVQLWLAARVVRDCWRPELDIVRDGGLDDPDGGLLDGRPDAPWLVRLRAAFARP